MISNQVDSARQPVMGAAVLSVLWLASGRTFAVLLVAARWTWPILLARGALAAVAWGAVAATLAYLPMSLLLAMALLWGPRGGALATLRGALLIIGRTAHQIERVVAMRDLATAEPIHG